MYWRGQGCRSEWKQSEFFDPGTMKRYSVSLRVRGIPTSTVYAGKVESPGASHTNDDFFGPCGCGRPEPGPAPQRLRSARRGTFPVGSFPGPENVQESNAIGPSLVTQSRGSGDPGYHVPNTQCTTGPDYRHVLYRNSGGGVHVTLGNKRATDIKVQ